MITIKVVDISNLMHLGSVSNNAARDIARNLMDMGLEKWKNLASQELHSSRFDYLEALQPIEAKPGSFTIALNTHANGKRTIVGMVEEGATSFDMHDTLLAAGASGVKTAKDGSRYRAIRFRQKTPGAGPTGGAAMGSQFKDIFAAGGAKPGATNQLMLQLGKTIHKEAKKLITAAERKAGKKGMSRLPSGLAPKMKQHHATDIFSGMVVHKQAKSGGGSQRSYSTFRMISTNADGSAKNPGSWRHPGMEAKHFAEKVAAFVEQHAPSAVESYMKGVLG